jgi:hypothetical protein
VYIGLKIHADFTKRENKNRFLENRTLKFNTRRRTKEKLAYSYLQLKNSCKQIFLMIELGGSYGSKRKTHQAFKIKTKRFYF